MRHLLVVISAAAITTNLFVASIKAKNAVRNSSSFICPTPDSSCVPIEKCQQMNSILIEYKKNRSTALRKELCAASCSWDKKKRCWKVCCKNTNAAPTTNSTPTKTTTPTKNATSTTNVSECGNPTVKKTSNRTRRIVGNSRRALLGAWPWMAALYSWGLGTTWFICGGTLISSDWVLTAAHCVETNGKYFVRLGDLNRDTSVADGATPIEVNVSKIIKYPHYETGSAQKDISLLRLKTPVKYTDHIRPICVRGGGKYSNESYYGKLKPVVIGWGVTELGGSDSNDLLEADLDVRSFATCSSNYENTAMKIDEKMICANTDDGTDSCSGDGGGPLMFQEEDIWWLGGIVSNGGITCDDPDSPGIYTKVASYLDWIRNTTELKF